MFRMKVFYVFAVLIAALSAVNVYGQTQSQASAVIDVGTGFSDDNSFAPSVLYYEQVSMNRIPWFRFGLGIRAWGYYANRTNLYTKTDSPQDYLEYDKVSANGLSFVVGANLRFWKIDLGINTDLIGASFGSQRRGYYERNITEPGTGSPNNEMWLKTSPVIFNVAPLFLENYNGQSEAYARIYLTRRIGVKIGYVYGHIAYRTKNVADGKVFLDNNQRRVSQNYGMPYAAVSFPLLH
ncbi:hypothetical protein SAMN05660293_04190 [Dyadobacter psychrophilus]|uniref:Outer membrane protein beta-barrel domain-containing protein n=2 Tax=Dyadobacter psychrophilus TaxID=651661 RepID=A0A1T5GNZ8_9BACT|nr:hypothetical protein SAMN05660293_04190 [Dyadobacter psychrophilus]